MEEQLDMFPNIENQFELSDLDIITHHKRMEREVLNKSGAITRLVKARYDDIISRKIAEENLELRKQLQSLKEGNAEPA